ncbi:MAG: glycoside hydrolase family 13 protein [Clostridia bacterium]|nr:glycoside hydrolase family 13 protein [Clostridia bacterium]
MKSNSDISGELVYFNSRLSLYKSPFGPIAAKKDDLRLRISASANEIQIARVEIVNEDGNAFYFDMERTFTVEGCDFFEATISKDIFSKIGIWKYKFLLINRDTKIEYGKYDLWTGHGTISEGEAIPFDLSVYNADFKTPDWMKNAVIYQILVDRFYDGNKDNNLPRTLDDVWDGINKPFKEAIRESMINKGLEGDWADPLFNGYNIFFGGDIQGVREKLDYLADLGVNVLYLNPIAWSPSNHKYDSSDLHHLDPSFGMPIYNNPGEPSSGINYAKTREISDKIFEEFAKEADNRGFRLILDGAFNHVGDDSIYFGINEKYPEIGAYKFWSKVWDKVNSEKSTVEQATKEVISYYTEIINPLTNKNYQYPDDFEFITWFDIRNKKLPYIDLYQYESWAKNEKIPVVTAVVPQNGDTHALPGFHKWNNISFREHILGGDLSDISTGEAEEYMKRAAAHKWIWMGASGWRIDAVPDITYDTWRKFRQSIKSLKGKVNTCGKEIDNLVTIGEVWPFIPEYFLGDMFDSVTNYKFKEAVEGFILDGNAKSFHNFLETIREVYPDEVWRAAMNLMGSHDTSRTVTRLTHAEIKEGASNIADEPDKTMLKNLAIAVIFQMGYPGAPVIFYGDEVGLEGNGDPDNRRPFPWHRTTKTNGEYTAVGKYSIIFDTIKKAINIRKNHNTFATGKIKLAFADGDIIAYALKSDKEAAMLVINRGEKESEINAKVNRFLPDGIMLCDMLIGRTRGIVKNGEVKIAVPAKYGLMMVGQLNAIDLPKVKNLKVEGGNKSVLLKWDKVDEAVVYNVYRSLTPCDIYGDEYTEKVAIVSAHRLEYQDEDVQNGRKYFYSITAGNGNSESGQYDIVWAVPHIKPDSIDFITPCTATLPLGVGNKTSQGEVVAHITGIGNCTDEVLKEIIGELCYYKAEEGEGNLLKTDLQIKSIERDKIFIYASFEPDNAGEFKYYARISTDNGLSYYTSNVQALSVCNNEFAELLPSKPAWSRVKTVSSSVNIAWNCKDEAIKGFEVYRKTWNASYTRIAVVPASQTSFTDFTVENSQKYYYKIAVFDKYYNRNYSDETEVQKEFSLVDVTIKVHLPQYTPLDDDIYIFGGFNSNIPYSHKLSRLAEEDSRYVYAYKFKALPGTKLDYSFSRGSAFNAAFISTKMDAKDKEDKSNWAYFDFSANMNLVVENQGDNRMNIENYIVRWLDMPLIIFEPAISLGSDIRFETTDDKFVLKANIPHGVILKVNGEPVPESSYDGAGNVKVDDIPLVLGENSFEISTERSEEILNKSWYQSSHSDLFINKLIRIEIMRLIK